ncbi:DUF418 domain-containing protein [Luteimonas yindakuii]|uniref:DUF418 domain-containing protein n=1 Tax=Luteimonas yindakuii TaxID=2565782 RepID=A0A4Z1RFS4_9GAMM|nr:DUF418 domain-containing protein [Luteimonas yindakuii]TKS53527.1 DUF418 domain-containing protein [Luteimonas yindakuii]
MTQWAPIDDRARIGALDALRALALGGIFVVNLETFNRPFDTLANGMRSGLGGVDVAAAWFIQVFVAGKAWLLFSLLFGIGFALLQQRGVSDAVWKRRTWGLLVIGLLHGALLWPGDILRTYALAAFLLLALRGLPPPRQRDLGLALYLGVWAAFALVMLLAGDFEPASTEAAMTAGRIYAEGGYFAVTAQRLRDLSTMIGSDIMAVPMALGLFLTGGWLLRSGRIETADAHLRWHRAMAWIGLPVGLLATVAIVSVVGLGREQAGGYGRWMVALALMQIAALPMAVGLVSAVVLAWRDPRWRRRLDAVAPAGRMALTHYLLQSLIASTLFYGYGLGRFGLWGPALLLLFAVAVFSLQVLASRWWLARFRFGPVEWAWRWCTYGHRPPLRRRRVDA